MESALNAQHPQNFAGNNFLTASHTIVVIVIEKPWKVAESEKKFSQLPFGRQLVLRFWVVLFV